MKNAVSKATNSFSTGTAPHGLSIQKILVVSKFSRYEYEKVKHKNLSETQFHEMLRKRGSDVEKMLHYHNVHKDFENKLVVTLRNLGVEVDTANK